uniref:zona pellucida sperm-binding protein 3-like n=1 Tax=Pristiophorus japonicus TaxID=55135 RepID=UPI00398EC5A0
MMMLMMMMLLLLLLLLMMMMMSDRDLLRTVMVQCGEQNLLVSVQMDLFGTRHLIKAADLTLGSTGCRPTGVYSQNHTVLFHYGLHECDSTVKVTDDQLIYTSPLYCRPSCIGGVIVRTSGAVVPIVCHYPRKRTVSRNAINPTWVPFSSTKAGEGHLSFSLHLMTVNWSAERASNIYHLGDLINIEASVMTMNHMPLKLYIDCCIATLSPDQDSTPRYNIIDFNGCLLDSRDEGSFSSFVSPRDHLDKLQFKLGAFRFFEDDRDLIFITCHLKVAAADQRPDSVNKACSFQKPANRWSLVTELDLSMVEGSNEWDNGKRCDIEEAMPLSLPALGGKRTHVAQRWHPNSPQPPRVTKPFHPRRCPAAAADLVAKSLHPRMYLSFIQLTTADRAVFSLVVIVGRVSRRTGRVRLETRSGVTM